jgi:hypothetical protein
MAVLWIILAVTIALSIRAGLLGRSWKVADSRDDDGSVDGSIPESWLLDSCARTFVLVLLSLLGLLALGLMYGNVLGAIPAAT